MQSKIRLHHFKPNKIPHDSTIAVISKRRTGKSTLIRSLICETKPTRIMAFIGSASATTFYNDFIPELFIYEEWDEEVIMRVIAYQEKHYDGTRKMALTIVIDDFGFDKKVMQSSVLRRLFQNGRHLGIQVIISLQFLRSMPLVNRGNFDIICVLRENNYNNKRMLYEECFAGFEKFAIFKRVLDQATVDYGVLVQDNTKPGTGPSDTVSFYKASPDTESFNAGHLKGLYLSHKYIQGKDVQEENTRSDTTRTLRNQKRPCRRKEPSPSRKKMKRTTQSDPPVFEVQF